MVTPLFRVMKGTLLTSVDPYVVVLSYSYSTINDQRPGRIPGIAAASAQDRPDGSSVAPAHPHQAW
jgi:hypothetical protein